MNSTNATIGKAAHYYVGPVFTQTENSIIMIFMLIFSVLGLWGNGSFILKLQYRKNI